MSTNTRSQIKLLKIDNLNSNDRHIGLVSSERLAKDVESLMNSSFWIDAILNRKAIGIGKELNLQLHESHEFIKNFVRLTVNLKRIMLKSLINNTIGNKNKNNIDCNNNTCSTKNFPDLVISNDFLSNSSNSFYHNKISKNFNNELYEGERDEQLIVLHMQFVVECIYLALLDMDDYIGTGSDILAKILEWFPQLNTAFRQMKSLVELFLNSTPCFKRVMNFTKSNNVNRPIILGKRQYIWSIEQYYLNAFIKHFSKLMSKRDDPNVYKLITPVNESTSITIPIAQTQSSISNEVNNLISIKIDDTNSYIPESEIISLFIDCKLKIDNFKILIQMKHNNRGFIWSDRSILQQNDFILSKLDFMKYDKTSKINLMEFNEKNLKSNKKNYCTNEINFSNKKLKKIVKRIPSSSKFIAKNETVPKHVNHINTSKFSRNDGKEGTSYISEFSSFPSSSSSSEQIQEPANHLTCVSNNDLINNTTACNEINQPPNIHCQIDPHNNNYNFNFLAILYANTSFFHQNELSETIIADENVEELLDNDLRVDDNEMSIEPGKFIFF